MIAVASQFPGFTLAPLACSQYGRQHYLVKNLSQTMSLSPLFKTLSWLLISKQGTPGSFTEPHGPTGLLISHLLYLWFHLSCSVAPTLLQPHWPLCYLNRSGPLVSQGLYTCWPSAWNTELQVSAWPYFISFGPYPDIIWSLLAVLSLSLYSHPQDSLSPLPPLFLPLGWCLSNIISVYLIIPYICFSTLNLPPSKVGVIVLLI